MFVISKVTSKASRCLANSVSEQQGSKKETSKASTIEKRNWKQKFFPKSRVFLILKKLDYEIFRATRKSNEQSKDAEGYKETHSRGNLRGDESRSKLSRRVKKFCKKCSTSKEYFR